MSDTRKNADECQRLLDAGYSITMFRNDLGSYTAVALEPDEVLNDATGDRITDDFTPSQALYRLTRKALDSEVV